MADDYLVLFNGTPDTPYGRYLCVDADEPQPQRVYRAMRDLSDVERQQILSELRRETVRAVAARWQVRPATVEYLRDNIAWLMGGDS